MLHQSAGQQTIYPLCYLIPTGLLTSRNSHLSRPYGGLAGGVPPLPIPNRAVKSPMANGTGIPTGRVGSRHIIYSYAS